MEPLAGKGQPSGWRMSRRRRQGAFLLVVGGLAILGAMLVGSSDPDGPRIAIDRGPNVVFVLADDQPDSTFRASMMPRTFASLDRAVNFTGSIAAPPLCCPYRAGVLSGQYPQNHGVEMSRPGYASLREKALVLPEFLREAGYETAFVGKYLNGTTSAIGTSPAPGWDRWVSFASEPSYENPELSIDGSARRYGGHRTSEVLTRAAIRFVDRARGNGQPFFLWLAHYAPHPARGSEGSCGSKHNAPALPADYDFATRFRFPRGPNWNHPPTGKPPWLREIAQRLDRTGRREMVSRWRCSLGAAQEVDRSIATLTRRLVHNGQMANTLFVVGSDNGTNFGEHRLERKKGVYEEKLQVPLMLQAPRGRGYGSTVGGERGVLVSQVDLTATILDIAGAAPCVDGSCRRLDGRSLVELLRSPANPGWTADRAVPIKTGSCWIRAFRTPSITFINSESDARKNDAEACTWPPSGFAELYRLDRDPDQLENLASTMPAAELDGFRARLDSLQRCSGIAGREPEMADRPFCE